MKIRAWGNLETLNPESCTVDLSFKNPQKSYLPIGNLRSYGDQALSSESVVILNDEQTKVLDFDINKGLIKVQSGMLLGDLQKYARGFGWMLPVLPGTRYVTVGGSIANDIHGKNHHVRGSFGEWVCKLTLLRSDSSIEVISRFDNNGMFLATIGGCGLTGVIIDATIQLVPDSGKKILEERFRFSSLEEFIQISQESLAWDSSVGWLNLYGKEEGIFLRGQRIATTEKSGRELSISFPPWIGPSLVNNFTSNFISKVYSRTIKGDSKSMVDENRHYFPLDKVKNWNRAYGRRGFHQYQFVVPMNNALSASSEIIDCIKRHGQGSFLTVIKAFGKRKSGGILSFPIPGITIAIDFQNLGERSEALFRSLDSIVEKAGGRLYLAKDSRMSKKMFETTYPDLPQFLEFRDPAISSKLSKRLMGY